MRVHLGDLRLNVESSGSGPPLVLLHGFTGCGRSWQEASSALARDFRVHAIDLIGHGESDAPDDAARYSMAHAVADLARLFDALSIQRAHILGYSMGGRVAIAFALARPDRIERLVVESGSPGIEDPVERAARRCHDDALAADILRHGLPAFVDAWMAQPLFASQRRLSAETRAAARTHRLAADPVGLANSLRGMGSGAQPSFWNRLAEIAVPTLLITGEEDTKFRVVARRMLAHLTNGRGVAIAAAGHATHLEQPRAFAAAVRDFLQQPEPLVGSAVPNHPGQNQPQRGEAR